MKSHFAFLAILASFIFLGSCKKGDTGGEATLVAHLTHHDEHIEGATLYVRFDQAEMPSDIETNYDLRLEDAEMEGHIHIEGLRYGEYYLYAVGFDSTMMHHVVGGVGVQIKWGERDEEIEVDIPMVEG
jgi:hypothetical protein